MSDPRAQGLFRLHIFVLGIVLYGLLIGQSYYLFYEMGSQYLVTQELLLLGSFIFISLIFFWKINPGEQYLPSRQFISERLKVSLSQVLILGIALVFFVFSVKPSQSHISFLCFYYLESALWVFSANIFLPSFLARFFYRGSYADICLLVGSVRSSQALLSWAELESQLGRIVVGLLLSEDSEEKSHIPILGKLEELGSTIRRYGIRHVIILETLQESVVHEIRLLCSKEGIRFSLYNAWQTYFKEPLILLTEIGQPFFNLDREPLESALCRSMKRCFDILFSLPIVLFLLPILALFVWVFQYMQAPGPLFYKQERTGIAGQKFYLYKFRSLKCEHPAMRVAPENRQFAFGRFIRKTSLDEFPQFINVLWGDMSVVGPRPHWIEEEAAFRRLAPAYLRREWVKPGVTGLSQVKGLRGPVESARIMRQRVAWDFYYITHWSLFLDLEVVFLTALQVLFPPPEAC